MLFLMNFVSSLSVSVDSPLSQGQQWSANISLSSLSNGEEARVFLNSEQVFVVAKISNKFFEISSSNKVFDSILNKDNGSLNIIFLGLSSGNYLLKVESNNNSVEKEIVFFEPVSKVEQERLLSKIDSLEQEISSLKRVISNLEEQNASKSVQISALVKENSELDSSLNLLNSKIRLLEQEGKNTDEILLELKKDLNTLIIEREEARRNPLTGFFAFGFENSGLLLGLFALISLIIAAVFIKSRSSSIYSNSLFGDDDVAFDLEDDSGVDSSESSLNKTIISPFKSIFSGLKKKSEKSVSKKKKWAVEPYHGGVKKEESKEDNFKLGDLIKKE